MQIQANDVLDKLTNKYAQTVRDLAIFEAQLEKALQEIDRLNNMNSSLTEELNKLKTEQKQE